MKQFSLLVLVMLLGAQAFGQKKKDATALRIDSLTTANTRLTTKLDSVSKLYVTQALVLDSVSKDLSGHVLMYNAMKEKVIKHDFDPARAGVLIDSLKTSRDQTMAGLTTEAQALTDSIDVLKEENSRLQESIKTWEARSQTNEEVVRDLEQLKSLLDQKILTQAEFDQRKAKLMAKWK
jgi:hypothetical protein